MPWLETAPVEERIQFIQEALSDRFTMSALSPMLLDTCVTYVTGCSYPSSLHRECRGSKWI
jgi:hypothetical protein